jgi:hypothetical protein
MPKYADIEAYSPDTGRTYKTWDALVAAEANGYVVLGMSEREGTEPIVIGPFKTKAEALKQRVLLYARWKKEEAPFKVHTRIRICWKPGSRARRRS